MDIKYLQEKLYKYKINGLSPYDGLVIDSVTDEVWLLDMFKNAIGYKGKTFIEAGYIFAPYIPILGDFEQKKLLSSRYADKPVNPKYYGTVQSNFYMTPE